jgi:hypothetical protein
MPEPMRPLDRDQLLDVWVEVLDARLHDSRAVLALLRARLGAGAAHHSEADVPPTMLADKLERSCVSIRTRRRLSST